jgi:zinc transport system substrate-binding protein
MPRVKMKKSVLMISLTLPLLFTFEASFAAERLRVAASFYPLAHFAEQVGGDYVDVVNISPPGAEPHEFVPPPRDFKTIWTSDILIYQGGGLDPWAEKIQSDLEQSGMIVVRMAEHFDLVGRRGKYDPHVWLDPLLAQKEVQVIRDAFIKADPENKRMYMKNAGEYIVKLDVLDRKYSEGLRSCSTRDIIVSHDAFSYLAGRYGLIVHSISGISPEELPSPRRIAKLAGIAVKKNIRYIFYEALSSPRMAETVAREVGGETLVLNPLGGLTKDDIRAGKTYISLMEENLRNLRLALDCE